MLVVQKCSELQTAVALDQWAAVVARANELSVAEFAAMADEMAVPKIADGEEVVQAASSEVQVNDPGGVVAQEMLMHFKEMLMLHITGESVAEAHEVIVSLASVDILHEHCQGRLQQPCPQLGSTRSGSNPKQLGEGDH